MKIEFKNICCTIVIFYEAEKNEIAFNNLSHDQEHKQSTLTKFILNYICKLTQQKDVPLNSAYT